MFVALVAIVGLQASPPCTTEPYHEFDFWLGEWDVTTEDGTVAGHNSITKQEGGCLIVEKWTSATGGTGQSMNFFDPHNGIWRQVWVSQGTVIDYAGGMTRENEMVLEGFITYHAKAGTPLPFRGTWTPMPDGTVRQHFEQFNPETKEWDEWFTGIYTRSSAP